MNLSKIYLLARSNASYSDFRNEIDRQLTGTPPTVLSKNEFTLIVSNVVLADVSGKFYCHNEAGDIPGLGSTRCEVKCSNVLCVKPK